MRFSISKEQYQEEIHFSKCTVRHLRFRLSMKVILSEVEQKAVEKYGWEPREIPIKVSHLRSHSELESIGDSSGLKVLSSANLLEGVWFVSGNVLVLEEIENDVKELGTSVYTLLLAKATFRGEEVLEVGEEDAVQGALAAALSTVS